MGQLGHRSGFDRWRAGPCQLGRLYPIHTRERYAGTGCRDQKIGDARPVRLFSQSDDAWRAGHVPGNWILVGFRCSDHSVCGCVHYLVEIYLYS